MSENNPRLSAFEARLAELRHNMEGGLGERAERIEGHLRRLATDPASAREGLRHESHKLRGIAGTFGHTRLGELAGALEQLALVAPSDAVRQFANGLLDAIRQASVAVPPVATPAVTTLSDAATAGVKPTRPRVLAVDDDAETRTLLDLTLRQLGRFDAVIVLSGSEALDHLTHERFDLVLCDAMMPDMNGNTLCERARKLAPEHPVPPIVILSAATADELGWNMDCVHAPFSWWQKPFRPKALVDQINALLDAR